MSFWLSKIPPKNLIEFCPERLFILGMLCTDLSRVHLGIIKTNHMHLVYKTFQGGIIFGWIWKIDDSINTFWHYLTFKERCTLPLQVAKSKYLPNCRIEFKLICTKMMSFYFNLFYFQRCQWTQFNPFKTATSSNWSSTQPPPCGQITFRRKIKRCSRPAPWSKAPSIMSGQMHVHFFCRFVGSVQSQKVKGRNMLSTKSLWIEFDFDLNW